MRPQPVGIALSWSATLLMETGIWLCVNVQAWGPAVISPYLPTAQEAACGRMAALAFGCHGWDLLTGPPLEFHPRKFPIPEDQWGTVLSPRCRPTYQLTRLIFISLPSLLARFGFDLDVWRLNHCRSSSNGQIPLIPLLLLPEVFCNLLSITQTARPPVPAELAGLLTPKITGRAVKNDLLSITSLSFLFPTSR